MKTKYVATAPDGQTFTRTSERELKYAAIVTIPYPGDLRTSIAYSGTVEGAHQGAKRLIPSGPTWGHLADDCTVVIVEVTA